MRKRNIKKQIWINFQEDNLLKKKSKESELSESEFIRTIANNINQIARIANSRLSVSHDDYSYISKELSDFILRFEKELYSRQK